MFVAVYWWRVKPGMEDQFRAAWRRGTELITATYGSHGSRLHRDLDGRFVGYAVWPDYETWKRAFNVRMMYDDPETRQRFADAIAETAPNGEPAFAMEITDDLLLEGSRAGASETSERRVGAMDLTEIVTQSALDERQRCVAICTRRAAQWNEVTRKPGSQAIEARARANEALYLADLLETGVDVLDAGSNPDG